MIKQVVYVLHILVLFCLLRSSSGSNTTWDVLVFTQHWPMTFCIQWKEESSNNSCSFPTDHTEWTIHGIWPSHNHTRGPFFCHSSLKFSESDILSLEGKLLQSWANIKNGTSATDFWKYEWKKHGTCASDLPQLDSVLKYFTQAIDWNKSYNISSMLAKSGIIPSSQSYNAEEIWDALHTAIGKNASVHCFQDKHGNQYLSEIRLCFNRDLELIDCDGIKGESSHISCPVGKPVYYVSESLPMPVLDFNQYFFESFPVKEMSSSWPPVEWLLDMLKLVRLVQWFTL